jgi:putative membrane protein
MTRLSTTLSRRLVGALFFAGILGFAVSGCEGAREREQAELLPPVPAISADDRSATAVEDEAAGPAAPTPASLDDAEILGVLVTASRGEIQLAELASTRAASPEVREFATQMIRDHTTADGKVHAVESDDPVPSDLSRSIEQQTAAEMSNLKIQADADFDVAYAESQAKLHQHLLDTIDGLLLPAARADDVRELIETLRPEIVGHLEEARRLAGEAGA